MTYFMENERSICIYYGADISGAKIEGKAHDSRYTFRGIGVQKLELIEKCQVDILGHISTVKKKNEWVFLDKNMEDKWGFEILR